MDTASIRDFKKKIGEGPVLGLFMKTSDPAFVEAAGFAKWDFAVLDMEHGPTSLEHMQHNIRAAQAAGILPIIRVASLNETLIAQALDIGAAGVQIPQVESAEQANAAVRAARYYPQGERGVCRFVRAADYSAMPRETYFHSANEALVILQLEGRQAVENLDEILSAAGVDILFIGPYDLSQSLGVPGQTTHPVVIDTMSKIVLRAQEKGMAVGTFTDDEKTMEMWMKAGVRYLSYSVDVGIFSEACSHIKSQFHSILKEKETIKAATACH